MPTRLHKGPESKETIGEFARRERAYTYCYSFSKLLNMYYPNVCLWANTLQRAVCVPGELGPLAVAV